MWGGGRNEGKRGALQVTLSPFTLPGSAWAWTPLFACQRTRVIFTFFISNASVSCNSVLPPLDHARTIKQFILMMETVWNTQLTPKNYPVHFSSICSITMRACFSLSPDRQTPLIHLGLGFSWATHTPIFISSPKCVSQIFECTVF